MKSHLLILRRAARSGIAPKLRTGTIILIALLLLLGRLELSAGIGQTNYTVAPVGYENVDGNSHTSVPFNIDAGVHYQQLYSASQFQGVGQSIAISEIRFRVNSIDPPFDKLFPALELHLSTTSKQPQDLKTYMPDNVGQDDTMVFPKGPLRLSSTKSGFDVVIPLAARFIYTPSEGNLLMDLRKFGNDTALTDMDEVIFPDLQNSPMAALWGTGAQGNVSFDPAQERGLVTQFGYQVVPEPSTLAILSVGFLAVFLSRGKNRSHSRFHAEVSGD